MDSDAQILYKAITKARANGFGRGTTILEFIELGREFDEEYVARELCCTKLFARACWPDDWEKHLLGMELVENPLSYLALFVE